MRIAIVAAVVALLGTLLFVFAANNQSASTLTKKLSIATIQSDVKTGAQLIDVRTPEEYNAGFIQGAINVPLASIQSGQLPTATKDKKIYLYCHSGNRAGQAKIILEQAGYTNVTNLGGMDDVVALGGKQIK